MARPLLAQVPAFEHERDMYVSSGNHLPTWSGRLLLRFEDNLTSAPLVDAVDRDLNHDAISFEIPGATLINIRGLGGGSDGSILVGGNAFSKDSRRSGFIAWISPDRKRRTLIQTEPFRPEAVVLATDGTIWAAGHIFDGVEGWHNTYNVIQRYDGAGKMLSSMQVPQARAAANVGNEADMSSRLVVSKDRVGWMTNGCEYIEFSLDGAILQRFDGPPETEGYLVHGVALSEGNDLILARAGGAVLAFDRTASSWVPVSIPGRKPGEDVWVLGFDGTTLVVDRDRGILGRFKLARTSGRRK
jgi:hypothetical protein